MNYLKRYVNIVIEFVDASAPALKVKGATMRDEKYLKLLSRDYPTIMAASSEIINLTAICGLPKGTEYFFSDLHGEYEAFVHLLRSASGIIRTKISEIFEDTLSEGEQNQLANLIYDPEQVLSCLKCYDKDTDDWKKITIYRLVQICKEVASKYTRSKVRKKMPPEFAYVIDELLHVNYGESNKKVYYSSIIRSIIEIGAANNFIEALCHLIQNLSVDSLHIIGDIFDRGPRPDIIMNELMDFHDVDIQWGNHDISWMGAACGNWTLIANVVRMGISYNNFDALEDAYGINLRPLSMFAAQVYKDDPCSCFQPRVLDENEYDMVDINLAAKMHKAISIIQFKLAGQLIDKHPEYKMDDRNILKLINYEKGTVLLNDQEYDLLDKRFPTIDPQNPLNLTREETDLMYTLAASFRHSEILHRHVRFLYSHGSTYKCVNSNLLFHGCIPLTQDGKFEQIQIDGKSYSGKQWFDYLNEKIHNAYFLPIDSEEKQDCVDFMWYLWAGEKSPMFGKSKLAAFENYFIADKSAKIEEMNPYYTLSEKEEVCDMIFREFGLDTAKSHIINGHVPVKIKDGEKPVKANGKLYVIDGGISKAYQSKTGIAGYTFIYNSKHLALAEHKNYMKMDDADLGGYAPAVQVVERMQKRIMVADTDIGKSLKEQIQDLKELVHAYQEGILKEKVK